MSDLTQRKGRIERQGNRNQTVYVCRYVTEDSFDAYLWQTVESKQKFIAQILTSKSPVRSCDDADETALSFAEIQALCAGDPRINLYVEVSRLKLMKADHMSKHFQMEDQIVKYFPEHIAQSEASIRGLEADMQTLAAHPLPEKGFAGIKIQGKYYRSREKAEIALSEALKSMSNLDVNGSEAVPLGSYRGLALSVYLDAAQRPVLTLTGEMAYRTEAVPDVKGNLLRMEHELEKLPQCLTAVKHQLDNLRQQQMAAQLELEKPFPYEQELDEKSARLTLLDIQLNLDDKTEPQPEAVVERSANVSHNAGYRWPATGRNPSADNRRRRRER